MKETDFQKQVNADIRRMIAAGESIPPPTTEWSTCWNCGGTKHTMNGQLCRMCDWRGMMEYEVRRA